MPRALVLVLDSVGAGGAPDAAAYGDDGACTLGHIARACAAGEADRAGLRQGTLAIPHLDALGIGRAVEIATGALPDGLTRGGAGAGYIGSAIETSQGKDTPSGHWEIAGAPAPFAWGYFPHTIPALPEALTRALIAEGGIGGVLGNRHGSGLEVIEAYGLEHIRTGFPIVYTSADSVLQISAHETHFGLERLYDLCRLARRLCDPLKIGRVIARPFVGEAPGSFRRTERRKDFGILPPEGSLLQRAADAGRDIISIGKIGDIFGHRFTGREMKGASNMEHADMLLRALPTLADGGLLLANFVDFDTDHGHRRDVAGYAACLEQFDARMPEIRALLRPGDLCLVTADHGNDPTWHGTDHTREQAPVLAFGPGMPRREIGVRATFADMGASLAAHLALPATAAGASFLRNI